MAAITLGGMYAVGGVFKSDFRPVPPGAIWPTPNVLPEVFPMRKMTPMGDDVTPADSYHRNSLEGVPWAYPYLVMLGSSPRFWVLRQGAPGMVMQNGTFDENGKWTLGNGGILKWDNPVAGTYTVIVDVFDQIGQVTFRHEHVCGDASKHIIVSVSGAGTGDGSSADNAMAWEDAYLGDTTLSPTQGKVLHLIGGNYPTAQYQIFSQYHSRNIVHYALDDPENGNPRFSERFNDHASHRFISGIEFNDIDWPSNGIIQTGDNVDYLVSWRNRFIDIRQAPDGTSDNESCHTSMGTDGAYFRKGYVVYQNYYEDVEIAHTDMFSLEEFLNSNETATYTNPAYTDRGVNPCWYSKAAVRFCEITHMTFINPTVNGGSSGVIHVQHSATQGGTYGRSFVDYNKIIVSGGAAIKVNSADNLLPIDAIAYVRRNSVVNGSMGSNNYNAGPGISRHAYFDRNAAQNSFGANGGVDPSSVGYTLTNDECSGTSGVLDSNGNLTEAVISYLYTRGAVQGIEA